MMKKYKVICQPIGNNVAKDFEHELQKILNMGLVKKEYLAFLDLTKVD